MVHQLQHFTKLLQGSLFNKFRNVIMSYKHISTISLQPGIKEGVEENKKNNRNVISVSDDGKEIIKKGSKVIPPAQSKMTYTQVVWLGMKQRKNQSNIK